MITSQPARARARTNHGLGYSRTDCLVKLSGAFFHDFNVVKKIQLTITMNVSEPKTVQNVLAVLSPTEGELVDSSIPTDASDKGNRK